ncbi:PREDICTED: uncharacterized protein LOC109463953 [Branchiostoma belcheri]|uniref:Uncharacterized protein LOC109463953 n=1 Tax=Branchiostoma belcheri TaxID=7741 RepID=A0A6P4YHG1_BRABE|nr:PREDICTED: uncharacterized protein LOC109463953 [Branchiostoma belcheri]
MASAMINNNVGGKTGVSGLFAPRKKDDSLHDHVRVLMQRQKNNFFKGMDDENLRRLPEHVRPRMPVTDDVYRTYVTKSVRSRCSKLVYAYEAVEPWGAEFREKLDKSKGDGGFGTLEATFMEAERLWREYSPAYKRCRAVVKPGKLPDGRRNIRRTRLPEDNETTYRKRLRETRETEAANNEERAVEDRHIDQSIILWQTLRPVIHALGKRLSKRGAATRELQDEGVRQEIASHLDGYSPPRDSISALLDRVMLEFQREILSSAQN